MTQSPSNPSSPGPSGQSNITTKPINNNNLSRPLSRGSNASFFTGAGSGVPGPNPSKIYFVRAPNKFSIEYSERLAEELGRLLKPLEESLETNAESDGTILKTQSQSQTVTSETVTVPHLTDTTVVTSNSDPTVTNSDSVPATTPTPNKKFNLPKKPISKPPNCSTIIDLMLVSPTSLPSLELVSCKAIKKLLRPQAAQVQGVGAKEDEDVTINRVFATDALCGSGDSYGIDDVNNESENNDDSDLTNSLSISNYFSKVPIPSTTLKFKFPSHPKKFPRVTFKRFIGEREVDEEDCCPAGFELLPKLVDSPAADYLKHDLRVLMGDLQEDLKLRTGCGKRAAATYGFNILVVGEPLPSKVQEKISKVNSDSNNQISLRLDLLNSLFDPSSNVSKNLEASSFFEKGMQRIGLEKVIGPIPVPMQREDEFEEDF